MENIAKYYKIKLGAYFGSFIILQLILRLFLIAQELSYMQGAVLELFTAIIVGFISDVAMASYIISILLVIDWIIPNINIRNKIDAIVVWLYAYFMLFLCCAEWLFWDEFSTRFNFIAVDYLIYTHEVIHNIVESYPIWWLLSVIALISIIFSMIYSTYIAGSITNIIPSARYRLLALLTSFLCCIMSFCTFDAKISDFSENRYIVDISKNGLYELFHAYTDSNLDFNRFYITKDPEVLRKTLRNYISKENNFIDNALTRTISSNMKHKDYNVVLIVMESMSADFMSLFGNKDGITPYLDELAKHSMTFDNVFAIGTRTVYGLSAITLSLPPIPGNAISRRPDNDSMFTIGSVLRNHGYDNIFLYGGYSYFDDMKRFFSGNGYRVIDRASFNANDISFSNVWGVCDEDVYKKAINLLDDSSKENKKLFVTIMTTSNHRPFTYPSGKISIPSGTGRKGGVMYADYALGKFLQNAKKKPWFNKSIFVITADHTASSAGKIDLDPKKYHIPLIIYAPNYIKPKQYTMMMSQIDIAPTLFGIMHYSYISRFMGQNVFDFKHYVPRAFISNYQKIGYIEKEKLVILSPNKEPSYYTLTPDLSLLQTKADDVLLTGALSYVQNAINWPIWNRDLHSSHQSE